MAGLIFACPAVDIAIYSTCKRISQKLLRNVCKFLELIYMELKVPKFPVVRKNQEELHIQGPEGVSDVRTCSSYPSKVHTRPPPARDAHTRPPTHPHTRTHTHTHTHPDTHTHTHKHNVRVI